MLTGSDIFHVISAIIPLYVATIAAYVPLKWGKLFTPEQCGGINKFVASFSVPLLSFQIISRTNPYNLNIKLVSADILQKVTVFIIMAIIAKVRSRGVISWVITGLSLTTLPNTLILGIPLMRAMYGDESAEILSQIVVLQCLIWYNILLVLFEVHAANERPNVSPSTEVTGEELENQQGTETNDENKEDERTRGGKQSMKIILLTVGRKLIRNPNTYASLAGIIWACIHFRWHVNLPKAIEDSISILSDGGLGMAMFSLGLFMASQNNLIACGAKKAALAMALKFLAGPALMAAPAIALGLRGTLLRITIVQAALPQGIVPFVFASEFNLHPEILSTAVVLGLLVAVPVGLLYYFLLAL